MANKIICPGCGRHCDLNEPHCGRGEEYRRTGKMPEQENGKEQRHGKGHWNGKEQRHGKGHWNGKEQRHGREQRYEKRMAHYQAADTNDKLIINLRDLSHIMRFLYEGKASQKRILIILNELGSITQRDLTEHLGIQPGSASEILSKLESAGLIIRTQNETDRRTTDVSLTDTGRELAVEALAQRRRRHEEMFSCISEEEKKGLLLLLERIYADWKIRYSGGGHQEGRGHHGGHGHFRECRHHDKYTDHECSHGHGEN